MTVNSGVQESIAHAVMPETIPSSGSLSPEQESGKQIREAVVKGGTDAGLETAAERRLDVLGADQAVDKAFGTRDKDGKIVRTGETIKRYIDAKNIKETVIKYLDEGFNSLSDPQKDGITKAVEQMIMNIPALRERYNNASSDDVRKAILEDIVANPAYAKLVAEAARGVLDPTKVNVETVSGIQIEITGMETRLKQINDRISQDADNIEKRIKNLQKELIDYREAGDVDRKGKVKTGKLDKLNAKLQDISSQLQPIEEQRQENQGLLSQLKEARLKLNRGATNVTVGGVKYVDISNVESQINTITKDLNDQNKQYQELLAQKNALERQVTRYDEGDFEKELKSELDIAMKEKKDLETEKGKIEIDMAKKKLELGIDQSTRDFEEQQFLSKLNSVFSEAAQKYLQAEIDKAVKVQQDLITKEAGNADNKLESALGKGIISKYFESGGKASSSNISEDYTKMFYQETNNPDAGIDAIAKDVLKEGGYSDAEITTFTEDSTKWLEIQSKVAKKLINLYTLKGGWLQRGGKISLDQQIRLMNTPWGEKALTEGVEAARDQLQKVLKDRLPASGKLGEWLRKQNLGVWAIILMILAGIGIFAATKLG